MNTKRSVKKRQAKERMLDNSDSSSCSDYFDEKPQYDGGTESDDGALAKSKVADKDDLAIQGMKMLRQDH